MGVAVLTGFESPYVSQLLGAIFEGIPAVFFVRNA